MPESSITTERDTLALARALLDPAVLGHAVPAPELIETHISCVVLTGPWAYKLRKPVRLPFLDFRTLQSRREDCERELRLNCRWAPQIYEQVVSIHGERDAPRLDGPGAALEYAVKMRQFPAEARLDRVIGARGLDDPLTDALALGVARMHLESPVATPADGWSRPELIREQVQGNLDALADAPLADADRDLLATLIRDSHAALARLEPVFSARLGNGMVRECHGDLHLANLVLLDGVVVPFDGVEFRADFRWVDIVSDLAFLLMDLHRIGCAGQAWRLLDGWLARCGDYPGLAVLRHYLTYRAMVRAKVAAIRHTQLAAGNTGEAGDYQPIADYLALAHRLGQADPGRALIITHGLSGSGKSFIAERLVGRLGAIRLRSDVERARLHPHSADRYSDSTTARVYAHLFEQAQTALEAGFPVILDATFLGARWRRDAAALARRLGVPLRILDVTAPRAVLEARIDRRRAGGGDPSEADRQVLAAQIASREPLDDSERAARVSVDSAAEPDLDSIADALRG